VPDAGVLSVPVQNGAGSPSASSEKETDLKFSLENKYHITAGIMNTRQRQQICVECKG